MFFNVLYRYVEFHFERYSDAVDSIEKLKTVKDEIQVRHQKPFETHGSYNNISHVNNFMLFVSTSVTISELKLCCTYVRLSKKLFTRNVQIHG